MRVRVRLGHHPNPTPNPNPNPTDRLEFGGGHVLHVAICVFVFRAVKPNHLCIHANDQRQISIVVELNR